MGKASKWFRGLFGLKKPDPDPNSNPVRPKKKWGFVRSNCKDKREHHKSQINVADDDASRHAVAVAAATAAVAEAAVAAAHAAAAVVKLTSAAAAGGGGGFSAAAARVSQRGGRYGSREEWAAVTIQSHFRAYLSRRALRALKALVKLQALVRGYLKRKQFTEYFQRMKALARAQARARAGRVLISEASSNSSTKSSQFSHTRHSLKSNGNSENSHSTGHWTGRKTGDRSREQGSSFTRIVPMDDDKILEVDTEKPSKYGNMTFHSSHLNRYCHSFSTSKDTTPLEFTRDFEEGSFRTADNSPNFYSASSMKTAPLTPTKSDGSRSCLSGYSDHPSYMAYTESSKAKVRSVSAPKQRPQYERTSSINRYSVHGYVQDSRLNNTQKVSALHANFTSKAYPGSGRLDRLGMPVRDVSGFSGGHWCRY